MTSRTLFIIGANGAFVLGANLSFLTVAASFAITDNTNTAEAELGRSTLFVYGAGRALVVATNFSIFTLGCLATICHEAFAV